MNHIVGRLVGCLTLSLLLLPHDGWTQGDSTRPPVAPIIEALFQEHGPEAAVLRLQRLLTDSLEYYQFGFREVRFAASWFGWQGRHDERMAMLGHLVTLFPESPNSWAELGSEHLLWGRRNEAESCLVRALAIDTSSVLASWQHRHLDELVAIAEQKRAVEGKYAPGQNTGIQGPYIGQQLPGSEPTVFAPGLISTAANEFSIAFSPDGKEIYFSRTGVGILRTTWEDSGWTAPQKVRFFTEDYVCDEPSISPDGQWIFFNARPSIMDERTIYRARRAGSAWGKPEMLFVGMYPTSSRDGTLYYTEITGRPDYGVLAKREPADSAYREPEILTGGANSQRLDAHPFIVPDESLLLFDSDRSGTNGLYVTFRESNETWGDAIRLDSLLGSPPFAGQLALSPDASCLFVAYNGDIYWIKAEFLNRIRP